MRDENATFIYSYYLELKNKNALSILKSLEKAKMIKLLGNEKRANNTLVQLKGAITAERAIELGNEINKSRNEWDERTI